MFVRPFRKAVAACSVWLVCLMPAASFAANRPMTPGLGVPHAQGFVFPIGRPAASLRLHDSQQRGREPMKPLEVQASPKPLESAFPSFSNPLHRHRMATLPSLAIPPLGDLAF